MRYRTINYRFWDTKEKIMLDWGTICQTAFNINIGLMYQCITTPSRFIPMQSTGLMDKNGKLIYEGDIIKFRFDRDVLYGVIDWGDKESIGFYINTTEYFGNKFVTDYDFYSDIECSVLGNIYEDGQIIEEIDNAK